MTTKQILLALVLSALFSIPSFADDGSSGCGLGWQVAREPSLLSSALRGTTNTMFLNTVGMTLGTSGCTKHRIVERDREAILFAEVNYDSLKVDMAQGRGEYIEAFAAQVGCADHAGFARAMQSNFGAIISSPVLTGPEFLSNVRETIGKDRRLASSCAI